MARENRHIERLRKVIVHLLAVRRILFFQRIQDMKTNADLLVSIASAKTALANQQQRLLQEQAASAAKDMQITQLQAQVTTLTTQNTQLQNALDQSNDATQEVADVDGIAAALDQELPAAGAAAQTGQQAGQQ